MRFMHPELLWLLLVLPLLVVLIDRRPPALPFSGIDIARLLPRTSRYLPNHVPTFLRLVLLAVLIVALARPQIGKSVVEVEPSGIDIMLAIDVSPSMKAMDLEKAGTTMERLELVKEVVSTFIASRPNDRMGLLAFAGRPFLICPLTLDHEWLRQRLNALTSGMLGDGTAIGSALGAGVARLHEQQAAHTRILILVTDGVNTSGKVPPLVAAEAARTLGVKVYTIGVGSRGMAPTPTTDPFGRTVMARVKVTIDEQTLQAIATTTGAHYYRATDGAFLENSYQHIDARETTPRTVKAIDDFRELSPALIGLLLLLVAAEVFVSHHRLP